jgi:hypothetical protein
MRGSYRNVTAQLLQDYDSPTITPYSAPRLND